MWPPRGARRKSWREGGILFKGIRNTLRLVNLESFKELDEMKVFTLAIGHRHLHYLVPCIFINGDTLFSLFHMLLDLLTSHPLLGAYTFEALQPNPCL